MTLVRPARESLRAFAQVFANRELRAPAARRDRLDARHLGLRHRDRRLRLPRRAARRRSGSSASCAGRSAALFAPWLALLRRPRLAAAGDARVPTSRGPALVGGMAAVGGGRRPVARSSTALAVVASIVSTGVPPAQAALLPSLARSPEELTASNVALSSDLERRHVRRPRDRRRCCSRSAGPSSSSPSPPRTFSWSAACVARRSPRRRRPSARSPRRRCPSCSAASARSRPNRRLRVVIGLTARRRSSRARSRCVIVIVATPAPARRQRRRRLAQHRARRRRPARASSARRSRRASGSPATSARARALRRCRSPLVPRGPELRASSWCSSS